MLLPYSDSNRQRHTGVSASEEDQMYLHLPLAAL